MNMRKLTGKAAILAAAICVAAATPAWAGAARYAQPVWSMGNYNPVSPTNVTATTSSTKLAFKGLTLAQLKAKLDDGYDMFAFMIGGHVANKHLVPLFNIKYYPSADSVQKIFGDFCIIDNETKAVCVEFTDGEDGVYVKALKALYANKGTADTTDFMNVAADGTVTYKNYKALMTLSTTWSATSYGAGNLQLAKFVPSDSPMLVWPGVTIDEIKDYAISCSMGGRSLTLGYVCNEYNRRAVTNETTGVVTEMTVELQAIHGGYNKCVVVRLTDGDGGVCAQAVVARNAANEPLGYLFSNGDGTYNGAGASVTTGYGQADYGVYGLTATKPVYVKEVDTVFPSSSTLVWEGATLEGIKNCYFGCRFTGAWIGTGSEGVGCNRKLEYNGDVLQSIRVEFQMFDGTWCKCVVMRFTNGTGGVYGQALKACVLQNGKVGRKFVNDDGTYNNAGTLAGSRTASGYAIYKLFALPCVRLEADEDWSPYGRTLLGDTVVDLNGHRLTSGELVFNEERTNMVVNTGFDTTGEMRFFTFAGGSISNSCVNIGAQNTQLNLGNIKVVIDGYGTYYADKVQEYKGGTEVVGGVLKPTRAGTNKVAPCLFGMTSGAAVTVDEGGVLDLNGFSYFVAYPAFVLNGGTIRNTGGVDFTTYNALLKGVTLTANSKFEVARNWGLINASYAEISMNLGGHTLDIAFSGGKTMYFTNIRASGAGRINATGTGILEVRQDTAKIGFIAPEVDLRCECDLKCYGPVSVHDYEAAGTRTISDIGSSVMKVYGTFTPETRYFHGCTMQDGSTMDFSKWPESAGWPVTSAYAGSGDKLIRFAAAEEGETTTVTVKLGDRRPSGITPIVAWNDSNRPDFSKVEFVNGDEDKKYSFVKKDDGLYVSRGFTIFVR